MDSPIGASRRRGLASSAAGSQRCALLGVPFVAMLAVAAACTTNGSASACPGSLGCACGPALECDPGLSCTEDAGCVPTESTTGVATTGEDTSTGGSENIGPPEIVSIEASVAAISEAIAVVTITAHVIDPDGLEDIAGGVASHAEDDELLGSFVEVSEGTFELELSWTELRMAGTADDTEPALLDVVFADAADNEDQAELELLVCPVDHGVCGGACIRIDTTDNCGACGAVCLEPHDDYCFDGQCCLSTFDGPVCEPPMAGLREALRRAGALAPGRRAQ